MSLESSLIKSTLFRRALAQAEFSRMNIMQQRSIPQLSPGSNQFSQKKKVGTTGHPRGQELSH